jgi:hypothetical protein
LLGFLQDRPLQPIFPTGKTITKPQEVLLGKEGEGEVGEGVGGMETGDGMETEETDLETETGTGMVVVVGVAVVVVTTEITLVEEIPMGVGKIVVSVTRI